MYRRKTRKMGNIVSGVEDLHHVYEDVAVQHRRARQHSPDAGIELTEQSDQVSPDEEVAPLVNDDVPHDLIAAPGTASNAQVAVNIIISFVGAGLLGIPDAFRSSGWALGSVALCTVSALNVYAMLLLVQVQQKLTKEGYTGCSSYGQVGRCILGSRGEILVNICLVISQAGFATAYIIFIAANLDSIAHIPRAVVCFGCIPGLALLVQAREMKTLSPFSLLADLANLAGLSAVLMQDFESYEPHHDAIHPIRWEGLLYVVAITIYSMEGVGLVLSLESSCQNRSNFGFLLKIVLACITLFMAFFGIAGYMAFGKQTTAPITLNLTGGGWATFVKCALCLALYLTYPIMMFPIWTISDDWLPDGAVTHTIFRCLLVLLTAIVAYSVPDFGNFLSLVGSSICIILGFILPCYFHLVVMQKELKYWQVAINGFLILGGALFALLGTYNSFMNLLKTGESIP